MCTTVDIGDRAQAQKAEKTAKNGRGQSIMALLEDTHTHEPVDHKAVVHVLNNHGELLHRVYHAAHWGRTARAGRGGGGGLGKTQKFAQKAS